MKLSLTMALSDETKESIVRAVDVTKTIVHYGWCVPDVRACADLQGAVCHLRRTREQHAAAEPLQVRVAVSDADRRILSPLS